MSNNANKQQDASEENHITLQQGILMSLLTSQSLLLDISHFSGKDVTKNLATIITKLSLSACEPFVMNAETKPDDLFRFLLQPPAQAYTPPAQQHQTESKLAENLVDAFGLKTGSENTSSDATSLHTNTDNSDVKTVVTKASNNAVLNPRVSTLPEARLKMMSTTARASNVALSARIKSPQGIIMSPVRGDNENLSATMSPSTAANASVGLGSRTICLIHMIERANKRTQAALLEVLANKQVMINDKIYKLKDSFVCVATLGKPHDANIVLQPLVWKL